jgi:hypothetical protein
MSSQVVQLLVIACGEPATAGEAERAGREAPEGPQRVVQGPQRAAELGVDRMHGPVTTKSISYLMHTREPQLACIKLICAYDLHVYIELFSCVWSPLSE